MATIRKPLISDLPGEKSILKRTLYVGGLDDNVDKVILQAAFVPFGDLRTIELPKDRATGKHRGFGFVEFEEDDDAQQAIFNMNEAELFGRVLTVNLARTPARTPGEGGKPVWSNDIFLRQRQANENQEDESEIASLLRCIEVQEVLQTTAAVGNISDSVAGAAADGNLLQAAGEVPTPVVDTTTTSA